MGLRIRMEKWVARRLSLLRESEGQSTVEFALTLILLMAFVFFFLQLSLIFAYGNFAHYATFMAARAYLSAGPTKDDQVQRATDVIVATLKAGPTLQNKDRFPGVAQAVGAGSSGVSGVRFDSSHFKLGDRDSSWLQGVRYTFRSRLFLLPLGGRSGPSSTAPGAQGDVNSLTLTAESWLGRDPSDQECEVQMGKMDGIFDNGC